MNPQRKAGGIQPPTFFKLELFGEVASGREGFLGCLDDHRSDSIWIPVGGRSPVLESTHPIVVRGGDRNANGGTAIIFAIAELVYGLSFVEAG